MEDIRRTLRREGFAFKKSLGQNFITDDNLLAEIVEKSGVTKDDTVIEIGCGAGTLTRAIARAPAALSPSRWTKASNPCSKRA